MGSKRSRRIRGGQAHPSCPHCDEPDISLLRLVLMGEILRADETQLVLLADVLQQTGLVQLAVEAERSTAPRVQRKKGTLHTLQRPGADRP